MSPTSGLTVGPRGRRVVLEIAKAADPRVGEVLWPLAYNANVDAGASIVAFGWDDEGNAFETRGRVGTEATVSDLAARIRGVGALDPDATTLDAAMLRAVDSARYWQAPDGEDIIAALPEVRAALAAVSVGLTERADTAWWRRDRAIEQWAIEFDPSGDGAPFDPAPGAADAWLQGTLDEEERARRDRPSDPQANWSGSWWSFPSGAPHTTGELPPGLPVGIPYVEDGFGWTRARAVPVRGGGRTFEIRDADDWAELCRRHPLEVTASRRHDWYRTTGRDRRWLLPDWSSVAEEWDAVHLTGWAYLTAATREIVIDDDFSSVLGGWGPDETYWLTGFVREVEGPRVHWVADAPEGPWRRAE